MVVLMFAPAIEHALDTMEQDAYKNADLLVVSDFIMSGLSDNLLTVSKNNALLVTDFTH